MSGPGDGYGETASVIINDMLELIARELVRAEAGTARHAWLTGQHRRFTDALSSSRVLRDPASVARLVKDVRQVRAAILDGR